MRKILLLIFAMFFILSCEKDTEKETYTFENSTEFMVTVKPFENLLDGSPDFELTIMPNETKTYEGEYMYSAFQVFSNETSRNFNYKIVGDTRVIYDFEYTVLYRITGSATSVDITYSTPSGGTNQSTVSVPTDIGFNQFADDYKYISAQNNNETGSVRVEIYFEDSKVAQGFCEGGFCIATAQY